MMQLKYTKIKSLEQYTTYCNKHEELFMEDEDKFSDEIELLEILIEEYDRRIQSRQIEDMSPVELLRSLIGNAGLSQSHFAKEIGISRQLVSDILNYRRNISKELVLKLSSYFSMTQEAFSRPYYLVSEEEGLVDSADTSDTAIFIVAEPEQDTFTDYSRGLHKKDGPGPNPDLQY